MGIHLIVRKLQTVKRIEHKNLLETNHQEQCYLCGKIKVIKEHFKGIKTKKLI